MKLNKKIQDYFYNHHDAINKLIYRLTVIYLVLFVICNILFSIFYYQFNVLLLMFNPVILFLIFIINYIKKENGVNLLAIFTSCYLIYSIFLFLYTMNIFDLNLNIIILILKIQAFIFLRVVIEYGLNNKVFKVIFHCHSFTIIFLLIINCVYYLIYNGGYIDLGITVTENILLSILLLVIITIFVLNNNLDSIKKPKNKIVDESINNEE